MDLVAHLDRPLFSVILVNLLTDFSQKRKAERHAYVIQHRRRGRKRRHKDSQTGVAGTSHSDFEVPPRCCELGSSKVKTPALTRKGSRKRQVHRQREASLKGPASS